MSSLFFRAEGEGGAPAPGGSSGASGSVLERVRGEDGDPSGDFEDFLFLNIEDVLARQKIEPRAVVLLAPPELVREISSGQDALGRVFLALILKPKGEGL